MPDQVRHDGVCEVGFVTTSKFKECNMNPTIWQGRDRLILDGSMGLSLKSKGVEVPTDIWSAHALMAAPDVVRELHADYIRAGADIITTCTADKQNATVLTDNMVGAGVHINAIGGDCPGKTELHRDILHRADIFVEYPAQTRIEGEIQALAADHPVTELWQVIAGQKTGRSTERQITLFDSVGFAIEDFSALRYLRDQLERTGHFVQLDLLADPDDPRDLFGMVNRAKEPV